jgi:quercetin dioxygenase-like cupin family protein
MSSKACGHTRSTANPPVVLKAGDVLFIPAGVIHSARNVGTGRGAELATYIVEKGKPLLVLDK